MYRFEKNASKKAKGLEYVSEIREKLQEKLLEIYEDDPRTGRSFAEDANETPGELSRLIHNQFKEGKRDKDGNVVKPRRTATLDRYVMALNALGYKVDFKIYKD